jgi:hypothetical protein
MWHAAIQDVPVGPMTRDELARKIESGAVTPESLCWREGMDDWRPLGDLAELQSLLRRPAPPRPSVRPPRAPPAVPGPVGARGSFFPEAAAPEEIDDEGSEPTRIADMTGSPHAAPGATSHPRIAAVGTPVVGASSSASIPAPAVVPHAPEPERARRKSSMSGSTGMAFGVALTLALLGGPLLWDRLKGSDPAPAPSASVAAPAAPAAGPKLAEADIDLEVPAASDAAPVDALKQPVRAKPIAGVKPKSDSKTDTKLSAAEQALLDRMGGGGGPDLETRTASAGAAPTGPALTATQLMKVVQDNKPALQRCYETALRSVGGKQEDTLKIKVGVTVGTSGSVKGVRTQGQGLGNMNDCLSKSVRRWRFPVSSGDSEFEFPLVFQPGA